MVGDLRIALLVMGLMLFTAWGYAATVPVVDASGKVICNLKIESILTKAGEEPVRTISIINVGDYVIDLVALDQLANLVKDRGHADTGGKGDIKLDPKFWWCIRIRKKGEPEVAAIITKTIIRTVTTTTSSPQGKIPLAESVPLVATSDFAKDMNAGDLSPQAVYATDQGAFDYAVAGGNFSTVLTTDVSGSGVARIPGSSKPRIIRVSHQWLKTGVPGDADTVSNREALRAGESGTEGRTMRSGTTGTGQPFLPYVGGGVGSSSQIRYQMPRNYSYSDPGTQTTTFNLWTGNPIGMDANLQPLTGTGISIGTPDQQGTPNPKTDSKQIGFQRKTTVLRRPYYDGGAICIYLGVDPHKTLQALLVGFGHSPESASNIASDLIALYREDPESIIDAFLKACAEGLANPACATVSR